MPTTRHQAVVQEGRIKEEKTSVPKKRTRKDSKPAPPNKKRETAAGEERPVSRRPASKKGQVKKTASHKATSKGARGDKGQGNVEEENQVQQGQDGAYKIGAIERGHIYFFYRPKVQLEEAHSIDEVRNFHILLIPRPPAYATGDQDAKSDPSMSEEAEMKVLAPGADAVPAPVTRRTSKQHYRLLSIGKKKLPDPEGSGTGHHKETFWATVTSIGGNLHELTEGLGPKSYETKTRGTRHEAAARLVARGGYAIVNSDAKVPSQRETHLGYHVSHPSASEMGDVQAALGVHSSSSFVVQVKNPLAPSTDPRMSHSKLAEYPEWIMDKVFGKGGKHGRESYGLRFATCETPELLDHVGAQLLLIAAREGEQGLEISLGNGRGEALAETENEESKIAIDEIFKEIGLDPNIFTKETLDGEWA